MKKNGALRILQYPQRSAIRPSLWVCRAAGAGGVCGQSAGQPRVADDVCERGGKLFQIGHRAWRAGSARCGHAGVSGSVPGIYGFAGSSFPKRSAPIPGQIDSISFEHVSFRYPESDAFVLRDVSFEIHGGEKISIVGLNGAGKTTLVKLLCRLYEPQEGRICINGVDILEYDREQYLAAVAAVSRI